MEKYQVLLLIIGCILPSIYIAYTDIKYYIIKHIITIPMIICGLAYSYLMGDFIGGLIGASVGFILMLIMALKGGIGGGDIWYTTALGAWLGIGNIFYVILIGSALAFAGGLYKYYQKGILKTKLKEIKSKLVLLLIFRDIKKAGFKELPEENDSKENVSVDIVPFGFYLAISAILFIVFMEVNIIQVF